MKRRAPAFPRAEVARIVILVALLVAVVLMQRRCGPAAVSLFRAFDVPAVDGGHD